MLHERHARRLRWLLIAGWLALVASLFLPASPWQGNRLFWGTVVPLSLLLIGGVSHELWRRVCPLAFVSQLAQALGWQRRRVGKGGRVELVMVRADSWLGRHHVQLQWGLLIAGLCLRLLGGNSDPLWLGLWLLVTLAAALLVGWAFGGKAWCHYICPMGPVQTVLTGMRGPLGSTAHVAAPSRLTQSMCRTITADGRERSACVSCQSTCYRHRCGARLLAQPQRPTRPRLGLVLLPRPGAGVLPGAGAGGSRLPAPGAPPRLPALGPLGA